MRLAKKVAANLGAGLAALSVLVAAGCFEERLELSLHGDGSGVLHVHRRSGEALSTYQLMDAESDAERGALAREALVEQLACWDGVAAWTNARSEVRDDRVEVWADAYFEDVNQLRCSEPAVGEHSFRSTTRGSTRELEWTFALPRAARPSSLAHARETITPGLAGLEILGEVVMPGSVTAASGATREGVRGPAWSILSLTAIEGELSDFEKRVRAGELTSGAAAAWIFERHSPVRAVIRSDDASSPSELEKLGAERRAAVESHGASELRRAIERHRAARESGGLQDRGTPRLRRAASNLSAREPQTTSQSSRTDSSASR